MCTESNTEHTEQEVEAFERLSAILDTLRQECPWDRKQTLESLRYLTIEEVHELSEAIVEQKPQEIKKELGDLAMHVLFYAKIAEENGLFTVADVYNAISDKLIARHPFIYRKEDYNGETWEQLKMREGRRNVLEGVPASLPSMVKAVRIQEKVSGMKRGERHEKDDSDRSSWLSALPENMSEAEFGDLLFALVGWGLHHGLNADDALCGANSRFCHRYGNESDQ